MNRQPVPCRSYTHARRYPWVIGRIGGWQLPTQLTVAQLIVIAGTLAGLVVTRGLWAHLPRVANLLVEVAVPTVAARAAGRLRVEGRSPLSAFAGLIGYLAAPRAGTVGGKPLRRARPEALTARLFVAP